MCQYTLFDVGGVEIHSIQSIECMCEILYKRSKQCQRCQRYTIQISKSLNVYVCSFPIFDVFDIHSITALRCI